MSDTSAPSSAAPPKQRIALFLDGTWNTVDTNTNVWRLKSLCAPTSVDGCPQRVYYTQGLGTKFGEKARGGIFGWGLDQAVIAAYEWLMDVYNGGDEIFIFGFSRGAYTARSLAGLVSKCGLLIPGSTLSVSQTYDRYRAGGEPSIYEIIDLAKRNVRKLEFEENWLLKYSRPVPIKVTAVWDTVGALGIPYGNLSVIRKTRRQFLDTNLRVSEDMSFHALAIDEHRASFEPTLWTKYVPTNTADVDPDAPKPRPLSQVEQRWFVGAHANVGGGCPSDLLAPLPLKWMMTKAATAGFSFVREIDVDSAFTKSPISDSFAEFMGGFYKAAKFGIPYYRTIGKEPWKTESGKSIVHTINETIDESVFERWRKDPTYRPKNLVEWAKRQNVEVAKLIDSVRADDPKISVPA